MNVAGCARCHTAQGYHEVILGGEKSTAPYSNVPGITCIACHYEKNSKKTGTSLRVGKTKDACMGCHDILVQNDAKGFSSCPQGSFFLGLTGKLFQGKKPEPSAHSQLPNGCVDCHMAPAETENKFKVGEHTFRVIT